MKTLRGIVATTHVDKHFERLSLNALNSMAEQADSSYIPHMVEHDPRIPPKGRMVSAKVVKLEDGEYGLETVTEEFEPGEYIEFKNEQKVLPVHPHSLNELDIRFDRSFRSEDDQALIDELSTLLETKAGEEGKKSLEPIAVLTIGGMFILGGVAAGVLNKIGSDSFDVVKEKIKRLMKLKPEEKEKLLRFEFIIQQGEHEIVAEAILTNPADEEIDRFLAEGLRILDEKVTPLFILKREVKKAVFEYKEGKLTLKFAVRKDAVPLLPVQIDARLKRAEKRIQKQSKSQK